MQKKKSSLPSRNSNCTALFKNRSNLEIFLNKSNTIPPNTLSALTPDDRLSKSVIDISNRKKKKRTFHFFLIIIFLFSIVSSKFFFIDSSETK